MKRVLYGRRLIFCCKPRPEEGAPVGLPGGIATSYATDKERRFAVKDNLASYKFIHNKVY